MLTHVIGQDLAQFTEKIKVYRQARVEAGLPESLRLADQLR